MSSPTLALIPAKMTSVGVPDKNWKPIINGLSCYQIALNMGDATCDRVALTTDADTGGGVGRCSSGLRVISRPARLSDGVAPMIDVVQHALEQVGGELDEIIVLLQPTSPLRRIATVQKAIDLMQDRYCSSVVSVSPCHPPEWGFRTNEAGYLEGLDDAPTRRQDIPPAYKRDGVVYAFRRWLVQDYGTIYGPAPLPLFTPPEEALSIDTPADWDEAVRRLKARQESDAALSTGKP